MPDLAGSRTHDHLRLALAAESEAHLRLRWSARRAEDEGHAEVAALLRAVADDAEGHAFELLEHLADAGDPVTGLAVGSTEDDLKAAIQAATRAYTEGYPVFAKVAREDGFDELASWFEVTERASKAHAARLTQGLESLG